MTTNKAKACDEVIGCAETPEDNAIERTQWSQCNDIAITEKTEDMVIIDTNIEETSKKDTIRKGLTEEEKVMMNKQMKEYKKLVMHKEVTENENMTMSEDMTVDEKAMSMK